jgi:hypothetical protein
MNDIKVDEDEKIKEKLNAIVNWGDAKEFHQSVPLKDIKVPERVIFMSVPDGKVFFDCHPAESRMERGLIF